MAYVWENFGSLLTLSLAYRHTSGSEARLYGNGKNQVEVIVKVSALDTNRKPLDLSPDDLKDRVYLCEFQTGRQLGGPWQVSDKADNFVKPVLQTPYSAEEVMPEEKSNDTTMVSKYLSCSAAHEKMSFSVGIKVPGVGEFNTSKDGTSTKNGPKGETGSKFLRPSYLDISTIPAIDYGQPENVDVRGMPKRIADFEVVVKDGLVIHKNAGTSKNHHNGVSSKATFKIFPKLAGYKFKHGDAVRNQCDVPDCRFPGDRPDMVRDLEGVEYDVQMVFVNQRSWGLSNDSKIYMKHKRAAYHDDTYVVGPNDSRHRFYETLEYGHITVCLSNHRVPEKYLKRSGWTDPGRMIRVNVADEFGNSGVIRIENSDSDDKFPQLRINGRYPD